jgi:hypothetical protein
MYKAAVEESKTSGADVLPDFAKTALKEILTFSQISISETDLTMLAKDVVIVTKVGANDAEPMTVRMGDFKIAINSSNLRNYCADNSQTPPIRVAAAGNNSNVDGYTHPHVEHGTGYCTPCFGEAQYILKNYIPAGYLSDAFQVMVQFLQTYGGSPFKHIQFFVPGHTVCRSCKSLVKSETTVECSVDGKMYCQACIGKDEVTGQVVAKHRLTSCDGCGKLGISSATSIRVNSYDKRKYCPECNAKVVVPPVEYIGADFVLKPGKCNCGCEYSEPVIVTDNVTGMISCTACGDVDAMVIKSFIDDKNAFNFWVNKFLREVDITDYQFSIPDSADDRKAVITCLNYIYQAVMAEEEAVPNKHIIARIHQTFYECGVCEKGVEFFTVKA